MVDVIGSTPLSRFQAQKFGLPQPSSGRRRAPTIDNARRLEEEQRFESQRKREQAQQIQKELSGSILKANQQFQQNLRSGGFGVQSRVKALETRNNAITNARLKSSAQRVEGGLVNRVDKNIIFTTGGEKQTQRVSITPENVQQVRKQFNIRTTPVSETKTKLELLPSVVPKDALERRRLESLVNDKIKSKDNLSFLNLVKGGERLASPLFKPIVKGAKVAGKFLFEEPKEKDVKRFDFLGLGATASKKLQTEIRKPSKGLRKLIEKKAPAPISSAVKGLRVAGELLPTTRGGIFIDIVTPKAISKIPKLARIGIGSTIAILEARRALKSPNLTPAQRASALAISGLAGTGTFFEGIPLLRGLQFKTVGRVPFVRDLPLIGTGKFSPTKTIKVTGDLPKGIQVVKKVKGVGDIGIIPEGSPARSGATKRIELPKQSPLKRGGFEVKQKEKALFLGKGQTTGTSQIGLFGKKDIPIEREFFITPQEPFLKIPVTRKSRLGLSKLFAPEKETKISFGIPEEPQIGIGKNIDIGRLETPTQFKIGAGSELEAIKSTGIITNVKRKGVTVIDGQGVKIFEFTIKKPNGKITKVISTDKLGALSSKPVTRVSGETVLSTTTLFGSRKTSTKIGLISSGLIKSSTPTKPSSTITTVVTKPSTIKTPISKSPTKRSPPPTLRSPPTTTTSPPKSPPTTTSKPPTIRSPPLTPPFVPRFATESKNKTKSIKKIRGKQGYKTLIKVKNNKLRKVNLVPRTKTKSLDLGNFIVDHSLGRTFKIVKTNKPAQKPKIKVPNSYHARNKFKFREFQIRKGKRIPTPNRFIERKTRLLDTRSEVRKITVAKKLAELKLKSGLIKPKVKKLFRKRL